MKYVAPIASLVELESLSVLLSSLEQGGGEDIGGGDCGNLLVGDCEFDFDGDGVNDF